MPERQRVARTLLEQRIWEREATYEEQVTEFMTLARKLKEPATLSVRHLQRLAAGQRSGDRATPSTRRVMREMFGHSLDELLGPPEPASTAVVATTRPAELQPDARLLTAAAARQSLDFAAWADADRVAPALVEHVTYELTRIAVDYVSTPPLPLMRDLVELRDTMFDLLRERPNPRQARELFFLTGATCVLLAHATQNLGDPTSAMAQARTAWTCAEQADHHGLRAWVRGTQALIAEWTRRPADAVKFARSGQDFAVTTDSRVRLASIEARALARLGEHGAAVVAIDRAQRARDDTGPDDDLAAFGGILTFPLAKQLYYAGGVLTLAGHSDAERLALDAIDMYETGPVEQRSYGDEALARVDVATARLARGDLDGVRDALGLVLDMPAEQRIRQLCDGLERLRSGLLMPRLRDSPLCIELAATIDDFSGRVGSVRALSSPQ